LPQIHVGTSGWHYEWWKGNVYPKDLPPSEWLAYFAQHLPTVEVNNSFYRNPKATTWELWRDTVPPGFRFAVKASKWITWRKLLIDVEFSLTRFLDGAKILGEKLGPVLYQLPPWFRNKPDTLERVGAFLRMIPEDTEAVIEFLHPSWWVDEALELLNRHHIAFSFSDRHDKEFPLEVTGPFAYLRLHGPAAAPESNYPEEALQAWARKIEAIAKRAPETYVYFDNDHNGFAFHNAVRLRELLGV
jgi:uncharacterized protein YecE (DUF72 family)